MGKNISPEYGCRDYFEMMCYLGNCGWLVAIYSESLVGIRGVGIYLA